MTPEELQGFRKQIDDLDDQIIQLLAKRAGVVQEVGPVLED